LGADLLMVAGAHDAAQAWATAAVNADPDDLRARVARAMVSIDLGAFDAARNDLEPVCTGSRLVAMSHWLRAVIGGADDAAARAARLQVLLSRPGLGDADRAPLAFALHRELDALQRH